jgi:hypothetical protein
MKYDLKNKVDQDRFKNRINVLIETCSFVELRKINEKRSLSQNSYLHLLFGWFAIEYGETIDFVKQHIFKKVVNKEIFKTEHVNKKNGVIRKDWRSSSNLDSGELTICIDRFRDYSSKEVGIYLPEPNETEYLKQIEIEIERNKQYL